MSKDRTDGSADTPGRRLEAYVKSHLLRGSGGITGLCTRAGITREVMYAWFRGDAEPQLGSLMKIAEGLGVTRVEVLAAMDDQTPEVEETMVRRIAREEGLRLLEDALASGRFQVPPGGRDGSQHEPGPQR